MSAMPVKVLRKYCVPFMAEAEPIVAAVQLLSPKPTVFQSEAMEEVEANVFHSWVFMMG